MEPELQYDDSSVQRYVCELAAAGDAGLLGDAGAVPDASRVCGFRRLPGCLSDPGLARAYSIDWQPGLVVVSWPDACHASDCP